MVATTMDVNAKIGPQVLIVEDDAAVVERIKTFLERDGYGVAVVDTAAGMRKAVTGSNIDLVILDAGLPDEDGWSALRWIRGRGDLPVLMLTGKVETADKVVGLKLGADDYLPKPFELRELLARVRSIHRRAECAASLDDSSDPEVIAFASWVLDLASQQLKTRAGNVVHLTQVEYRILALLARNPRQAVSRDRLMEVATGREWGPDDRSIDVHISNLRRKLVSDPEEPSPIRTVRGSGYMLVAVASKSP